MAKRKERVVELTRPTAERVITDIADMLYRLDKYQYPELQHTIDTIRMILTHAGVMIPRDCEGEAHKPEVAGNIDHCGVCMPNWGVVRTPVKITR